MKALRIIGLPGDIRNQIKQARKRRNWSQRELGRRIRLTQAHISAIESGTISPRWGTVTDLLRVLDLDLLLVPRPLVPAVNSLIHAHQQPEEDERPLYAVDQDSNEV